MATTATSAKRQASAAAKRARDGATSTAKEAGERATEAGRSARTEADALLRSAEELAATVGDKLKAVGVDTDKMADVAKEQASELQRLIEEEIRDRPLRALGLAAAVGLFVGFLAAR